MDKEQVKALLLKYEAGDCTAEEKALVEHWYYTQHTPDLPAGDDIEADLDEIWRRVQPKPAVRRLWPRIAAAASIVLALSAGGYFLLKPAERRQQLAQNQKQDIAPGHDQATLTLANGKRIMVTKGLKGRLAMQGATIIQANTNDISYNSTSKEDQLSYNSLSTARGEQSPYPLVLADGTKVWLNAESSITFPTVFNGKERVVKLTGEAYFEVKHNAAQPFRVQTTTQTIEDIGTHFNVNAYADEPVQKTTLVEGAVKVTAGNETRKLQPGQQAAFAGNKLTVTEVDLQAATAWQKGYFYFDHADIKEVMRQIARWYKVEVTYEGAIPKKQFKGKIYRNVNLQEALKILAYFNVHFRVEGKTVIVSA